LFDGWPFPLAVAVLTSIAFGRGGITYALGRVAESGANHTRARRVINSKGFGNARRAVNRWGPPVVSLSFLTVGVQTLINIAAGVSRMPLRRYLPALAIGALLWGFLYATVGFVTFGAWLRLYDRSPVAAVVVLVVIALGLLVFLIVQLRSRRSGGPTDELDSVRDVSEEQRRR
jgi:membrane protein DedA with SNARE-associated domain